MTVLYAKDSEGNTKIWSINNVFNVITTTQGELRGKMKLERVIIYAGGQGTTVKKQVSRYLSNRIDAQLSKGYTRNIKDIS